MLPKVVHASLPPGLPHERVLAYHARTKHRADGYAAGPATVDWDAPPAPFRSFEGAPVTPLPLRRELPAEDLRRRMFELPYTVPARERTSVAPRDLTTLGVFLEAALGLTAWKSDGLDRWSVRAHPSSGNLHPVEAYVLTFGLEGAADGVHHHCPRRHLLEQRRRIAATAEARREGVWIALTTLMWREAWKYGERAFRYCQLDVGHVVEALRVAAAALGFEVAEVEIGSEELARLLGLDGQATSSEREEPELLLQLLRPGEDPSRPPVTPEDLRASLLPGVASVIDRYPLYEWPALDEVAAATRCASQGTRPSDRLSSRAPRDADDGAGGPTREWPSHATVIWGRRSAQRFARDFLLPAQDLDVVLRALAPALSQLTVRVFPRRVDGLAPGLLALRSDAGTPALERQEELSAKEMAEGLFRLHCRQAIAADAAVVFGLWARWEPEAQRADPVLYRRLHRAAGAACHRVYLAAEAVGLRATGIGCFLDDEVRRFAHVTDADLLPLYHVALGRPLPDPRFSSAPPYAERDLGSRPAISTSPAPTSPAP